MLLCGWADADAVALFADGSKCSLSRLQCCCTGVAEADAVVLLADGQVGLQAGDQEILMWLRTHHPDKRLILAVNKCENSAKSDLMVRERGVCGVWNGGRGGRVVLSEADGVSDALGWQGACALDCFIRWPVAFCPTCW